MERARRLAGPGGVVLVTGSLFTVGEARTLLSGGTSDLP
jgi:dihydrofolate synthase/folylpolyglutamate synthase